MNKEQAAYEAGWETALATKNKNESERGIPTWLIGQDKEIKKKCEDLIEQLKEVSDYISRLEDDDYNGISNWFGKSSADYSTMAVYIGNALSKLEE